MCSGEHDVKFCTLGRRQGSSSLQGGKLHWVRWEQTWLLMWVFKSDRKDAYGPSAVTSWTGQA